MPRNLDDELDALLSIGAVEKKPDAAATVPAGAPEATGNAKPEGESEAQQPDAEAKEPEESARPKPTPEEIANNKTRESTIIKNEGLLVENPPPAESPSGRGPAFSRTPEETAEILDLFKEGARDLEARLSRVYEDKPPAAAATPAPSAAQASTDEKGAAPQPQDAVTAPPQVGETKEALPPEAEEEAVEDEQIVEEAAAEQEKEDADNMPDLDMDKGNDEELVPPIPPTPPPPEPPKGKEKPIPQPGPRKQPSGRGRTPRIIQQIEDRTNNLILALIAAAAVGVGAVALWPNNEPHCSIERPTREQLRPVCNNIPGAPTVGKDWQCKKNGPGFDCTARVEIPSQDLASPYYRFRLPEVKKKVELPGIKFEKR